MPKPASRRTRAAALLLAAPVALLNACSPPGEGPAASPGTTPSIWTGSPAPSPENGGPTSPLSLTANLKAADGTRVATAKFEFADNYVRVTVATTTPGELSPGFHGLHIHSVGACQPDSVASPGGVRGNFLSAGGHYQVPGHTGQPASGDLTSLEVRSDGAALLVTTTDAFTRDDLLAGDGTALIIHGGSDNFANIPAARYSQINGTPGPDETTLSTGDAGKRVACGVIGAG